MAIELVITASVYKLMYASQLDNNVFASNVSRLLHNCSVGMTLSELRLLYIAQNPHTILSFVSLEMTHWQSLTKKVSK